MQEHPLPQHQGLRNFLRPLTGGLDLLSMNGPTWKKWRSIYNPGFSTNHLIALVPDIVRETLAFCDILQEHAERKVIFRMKPCTDNLAIDVIGKVVLDAHFGSQRSRNPMIDALRRQIRLLSFGEINPFRQYNPVRPIMHYYNTRQMNKSLSQQLDGRFATYQNQNSRPTKSVVDLAFESYIAEEPNFKLKKGMDATFKDYAISQTKLFLFSGHDTTSSSICYIFYVLSVHKSVLQRVRDEHDKVLGFSKAQRVKKLDETPHLLNQLPYTLAVIKETMRLFPVVSSTRAGVPGLKVVDTHGRYFPTDGFLVWSVSQALHRDPAWWPQPDTFLPDRWLADPGDPLHPVKGAWRPFEYGPRSCIGQELAMMEMKIVMILALHQFDIEVAYHELDQQNPQHGKNAVQGERAYQVQLAQPSGDLPCRIRQATQ
ncbi:hypothetical protein MMC22_001308 [Lobaria immixta]|nr:hypothetical protein [Lobaria immixta]